MVRYYTIRNLEVLPSRAGSRLFGFAGRGGAAKTGVFAGDGNCGILMLWRPAARYRQPPAGQGSEFEINFDSEPSQPE